MELHEASDSSVLVVLADSIGADASARVASLFRALTAAPPAWLVDVHPAYCSVLIHFDPDRAGPADVAAAVSSVDLSGPSPVGRVVEVPVRYDGPDLARVAAIAELSVEEVIALHCGARYGVAFVGFLPGFAYLSGLPPPLARVPRLDAPRARVPRGSVAVAGGQAGIYPEDSPGGWNILGSTPLALEPGWVSPGDAVRFLRVAS